VNRANEGARLMEFSLQDLGTVSQNPDRRNSSAIFELALLVLHSLFRSPEQPLGVRPVAVTTVKQHN
jgi:hypothetical protein